MSERVGPSIRPSVRPPMHSIVPRAPSPLPANLNLASSALAFVLTQIIALIEWATTPLRVLFRVLILRTKRSPMTMADEVNALCGSITKAVEGPSARVQRVTNAELLAEMTSTVLRSALGKPPSVVPHEELGRSFPESYLVPFHGQPNGYLSTAAAAMAERHAEVLFGRDLSPMRHAVAKALGENLRHGMVLDLGSGSGAMLRMLRVHHKRARLFGIELSPYMIAAAYAHQLHFLDDHVEVVEANVTTLPFDKECARGVVASFVLHELPEQEMQKALKEAVRVLAHGGRLVVLDHAEPRSIRERVRLRVAARMFHEPYLQAFLRLDLGAYLERLGLQRIEHRAMPRSTMLYVYEKPADKKQLN